MSSARVLAENDGESALMRVQLFDGLPSADAAGLLRSCCASGRWIRELESGRPYGSMRRVLSGSDDILADLRWADLVEALAAIPRQRQPTGRMARELLAGLQHRLLNPTAIERDSVLTELAAVVRFRLITTLH